MRRSYDAVVVGAGFAGAVMAERLASERGQRVLVIERRPHVAGNAYDEIDEAGVRVHRYGPHIFHTNSDAVFDYLSRFTSWRPYEHRVLARVRGQLLPIPLNRTTVNRLYGLDLRDESGAAAFYASRAEGRGVPRTSEEAVVGRVGRHLYELFFRGYTRKQWGLDPSQLDASVTARIPVRTNTDDRYFTDRHQAMPRDGYTSLIERMLDRPGIDVRTGVDFNAVRATLDRRRVIYTGPIDEYFDHCYGRLPYRSLRFEFERREANLLQPVGTINEPDEAVPWTRTTEFKHLTGQRGPVTTLVREFPTADGDPYYPIPRPANEALYRRYQALAESTPGVTFVGRLATYRYYNMDQVVAQALATWKRLRTPKADAAA